VLPRVLSGEVDFGIGPERETSGDIVAQMLFELPFVVVFPSGHPLESLRHARWDDALSHSVIALQGQFTQRLRVDLHASLHDKALNPTNQVNYMTTALALVRAGQGVAICLPYASSLIRLYALQSRLLLDPVIKRKFFVFSRRDRPLSPAARRFSEFLFDYVTRHDWGELAA
jgi:DNA-binding transcriptional LysR family regulator